MKFEFNFPEIDWLRVWWRTRRRRVRQLEAELRATKEEVTRLSVIVERHKPDSNGVCPAAAYWARRGVTEVTWDVILWHVRQRVTKKYRADYPLARFVDNPTEEEAMEVLREMWQSPPAFAPPEAARAQRTRS